MILKLEDLKPIAQTPSNSHIVYELYIYPYKNTSLKVIILQCSDRWPLSPAINHVTCGCQQATGIQLKKCGKFIGKVVALGCEQSYQLGPWKDMGRWRNTCHDTHGIPRIWWCLDSRRWKKLQLTTSDKVERYVFFFELGSGTCSFALFNNPHCTLGGCL